MSRLVWFGPPAPAATIGVHPSIAWFQGATDRRTDHRFLWSVSILNLLLRQGGKQRTVQDPLRELLHGQVLVLFPIHVEKLIAGQQAELYQHGEFPSLHPESRHVGHGDHFHLRQALPLAVALLP